jgi:hypothetical protein
VVCDRAVSVIDRVSFDAEFLSIPEPRKRAMRRSSRGVCVPCCFVFAAVGCALAVARPVDAANFNDLLRRIPPGANAVMLIDANAVMKSPIAVRDGWKSKQEAAYVKKPFLLPPEADRVVIAAQLRPNDGFRMNWQLAVMSLTETMSLRAIARAEGGYIDNVAGVPSVWTPSGAYFVQLDAKTMGIMMPASRQTVSRWTQFAKSNSLARTSDYLSTAVGNLRVGTPIVIAVDLQDAPQPHKVRASLQELPIAKGKPELAVQWEKIILGIQGITVKVHLDKTAKGTFQIDFKDDVKPFGSNARALVMETLKRLDAEFEDLNKWKLTLRSRSIIMDGNLTTANMRKLFSLLEIPTTKFSTLSGQKPAPDNKTVQAKASKRYLQSTMALLKDLQKSLNTDGQKKRAYGVWYERYARRIDGLPILNVDAELLKWGAAVTSTMRGMANVQRTSLNRAGVNKSAVYGSYQYSTDSYGYYYNVRSTGSVKAQVQARENQVANTARFNGWKGIEDSIPAIRQKMTKRYGVEFH